MDRGTRATAIELAAQKLRKIVLADAPGAMIGSEDALVAAVGCSRATLKQAARLLEREGLLKVRRGSNGGYFGTRPDAGTIEAVVSAHLETLDIAPDDATIIASALWIEAMRRAASAGADAVVPVVEQLRDRVAAIPADAPFGRILELELATQAAVFALARSRYVQLIFDINTAFFRRNFAEPRDDARDEAHLAFVGRWRIAKQMELNALLLGDAELAAVAGRQGRAIWHERVRRRLADTR